MPYYEGGRLIIVDPRDNPRHFKQLLESLPKQVEANWSLERDSTGTNLWIIRDRNGLPTLYGRFYSSPSSQQIGEFLCTLLNRMMPQLGEEAGAERLTAALDDLLQQVDARSPALPTAETL